MQPVDLSPGQHLCYQPCRKQARNNKLIKVQQSPNNRLFAAATISHHAQTDTNCSAHTTR